MAKIGRPEGEGNLCQDHRFLKLRALAGFCGDNSESGVDFRVSSRLAAAPFMPTGWQAPHSAAKDRGAQKPMNRFHIRKLRRDYTKKVGSPLL